MADPVVLSPENDFAAHGQGPSPAVIVSRRRGALVLFVEDKTGRWQTTGSLRAAVEQGTATWQDDPDGDSTGPDTRTVAPVPTAVRFNTDDPAARWVIHQQDLDA